MTRRARTVFVFVACVAVSITGSAVAGATATAPPRPLHAPLAENPTPIPPEPVPIPPPSGPCADPTQRCPDLVLEAPSELQVLRTRSGRLRLGSRNMLVNRGAGPLSLLGTRDSRTTMTVRQRIYTTANVPHEYQLAQTYFDFWLIPGQGHYWKLRDALRFELWTAGGPVERFVKRGRKTRFCMRDLRQVRGLPGPRVRQFPACEQSAAARSVRMGVSVGWLESYPAGYFEQYVDITGMRGCYALHHIADPLGHVFESDESNNMARTRVRLPPRRGRVRGC